MKMEQVELTTQQEKAWSDTRVALLWQCPAFSHIFYTMLDNAKSKHVAFFTKDVPIAATDGSNLILNPETFFEYPLQQRVFACVHEIMHCILNHIVLMHGFHKRGEVAFPDGSKLPYIDKVMNIATDYVINDLLIESKVGDFSKDWLHDTNLGTAHESAIDVYKKVYKDLEKKGKIKKGVVTSGGNGQGDDLEKGRFDQHLPPGASQGQDAGAAAQQRNESEWQTQIAAAANSARAQGKLPAGLERMFNDILNPQVDWREHIQALFARKVGSGSYDWRRADRRLIVRDIYAPGRSGFGAGTVVMGVDTSGSIGPKELDMFFAEMAGILEDLQPKRLLIMWCDAKLHRVDEAGDPGDLNVIRHKGAPGGGGTDFRPVFHEIDEMGIEPDALVYLTDGMGTFPKDAPKYPVIWGNIYPESKYPFGDVVNVPKASKDA